MHARKMIHPAVICAQADSYGFRGSKYKQSEFICYSTRYSLKNHSEDKISFLEDFGKTIQRKRETANQR